MAGQATMKLRRHCAAIPITVDAVGELNVLLVRSRGSDRWVVPRSWASRTATLAAAAAREAFEKAGVVGPIVGDTPVARYRSLKRLAAMRPVVCEVSVFLLRVPLTCRITLVPRVSARPVTLPFHGGSDP